MKFAVCLLVFVVLAAAGFWLWTPDKSRAALEANYLSSPDDMIVVADTTLHVRDSGPRTPHAVILLHGFGSSLHTWEPWAQALQDDYRVVRLDLPGSGLSLADPSGRYDDARTTELLVALMDRLGLASAVLVGNSIGGRIAWNFAAQHPDRVTKLVLISPDGFASGAFRYGEKPSVPFFAHVLRYVLPKSMIRSSVASAYGNPALLTDETVDRYYDLMLAPGARDALISRMEQTVLQDPVPTLRKIQLPVLLLWGEKDRLIPVSNAMDYSRELPQSEIVAFPELGHVPQEEAPTRSLQSIKAFLAR